MVVGFSVVVVAHGCWPKVPGNNKKSQEKLVVSLTLPFPFNTPQITMYTRIGGGAPMYKGTSPAPPPGSGARP